MIEDLTRDEAEKLISNINYSDNVNLVNFFDENQFRDAKKIKDSFYVKCKSDNEWLYFFLDERNIFEEFLSSLNDSDKYFAMVEDWMLPSLEKKKKIEWKFETIQYYLPETVTIDNFDFLPSLKIEHKEYIFKNSNYKDYLSVEYIKERIEKGVSSIIMVDNTLAAWALTQDDGAIGFLHVLPKFRRRGLAEKILRSMIQKVRAQKKIPICYVEEKNEASTILIKKMGFEKQKKISWVKLK